MGLFTPRKRTDFIAVHCSATPPSVKVTMAIVRGWHKARGFIAEGYHYLIRRDGGLEIGRPEGVVGAHVEDYNHNSIGICLAGGVAEGFVPHKPGQPWKGDGAQDNFTPEQFATLKKLLKELKGRYPNAVIQGHRDFPNVKKSCPSFDVKRWLAVQTSGEEAPPEENTFTVTEELPTYWRVAKHLGIDVYDLMDANPGKPALALRVGDVLTLPK